MPSQASKNRFLQELEALGGRAGNKRLRETLGWQESTYRNAHAALVAEGRIVSGRGGSVQIVDGVASVAGRRRWSVRRPRKSANRGQPPERQHAQRHPEPPRRDRKRLQRMLAENPLRTDFQQQFEELVARYNQEMDRQSIEQTIEKLLKVVAELDRESERAGVEGMDEETLAIFNLLKKPDLVHRDRNRIKSVARELLADLKAAQLQVDRWREKQATRDVVHAEVHDFLYSDDSGLPDPAYSPNEVEEKTEAAFHHLLFRYGQGAATRPHA